MDSWYVTNKYHFLIFLTLFPVAANLVFIPFLILYGTN